MAHCSIGSNFGAFVAVIEGGHTFTQAPNAGNIEGGQSPVGQDDRACNLIMCLGPRLESAEPAPHCLSEQSDYFDGALRASAAILNACKFSAFKEGMTLCCASSSVKALNRMAMLTLNHHKKLPYPLS